MEDPYKLIKELMDSITTTCLDMGGNHRYALSHKSMRILTRMSAYLIEADKNGCVNCEHYGGMYIDCLCPSLTTCPAEQKAPHV